MILELVAAAALGSDGGPILARPVWDARGAIEVARQTCSKYHKHLNHGHAILQHEEWRVWFGKDRKGPECGDHGAMVDGDGSKTDCVTTVC